MKVEMVRVYQVDWSFSMLTPAEMRASGADRIDRGLGATWFYDDFMLAAARAKRCLAAIDRSGVVLTTVLMAPEDFATLPADDDPEALQCLRP